MYKIIKWSSCIMWFVLFSFLCFKPKQTEFKLNETPKSQQLNVAAVGDTFTLNADQLASWGITSGSITFTIIKTGLFNNVAITDGRTNLVHAHNLTIPDTVIGDDGIEYQITIIDDKAFGSNTPAKISGKLTLPNSLIEIYSDAFSYTEITGELVIPQNVRYIEYAFRNCELIETITFKNQCLLLTNYSFNNCIGIKQINIPFMQWQPVNLEIFKCLQGNTGTTAPPVVVVPKGSSITLDELGLAWTNWTIRYSGFIMPTSWMYITFPLVGGILIVFCCVKIYRRKYPYATLILLHNGKKIKTF